MTQSILQEKSLVESYVFNSDKSYSFSYSFYSFDLITIDTLLSDFLQQNPQRHVFPTLWSKYYYQWLKLQDLQISIEVRPEEEFKIGSKIGHLTVIDRTNSEVLVEEKSSELNFLVSFLLNNDDKKNYRFTITTQIMSNNWLRKLQFKAMQLLHTFLKPILMTYVVPKNHS